MPESKQSTRMGAGGRFRRGAGAAAGNAVRWAEPAGLLMLFVMSIAASALGVTISVERLSPAWAFNVGTDVLGVIVCTLLFYGCFSERKVADETTRLFMVMLFCNASTLFLDMASWMLEGIPELRLLNTAVYALYLCGIVLLCYQFWRYIRAYLSLEGRLFQICDRVLFATLILSLLICAANLFVPLCFYVDEHGVYYETDRYLLVFAYLPIVAVCATLCLLRTKAPLRNKIVIAIFYVGPLIYAITYVSYEGAALPDAPLLAVILMYVVLVSGRSKAMAATATELNMAARIQADMLPNLFPAFPERSEFDIFASMDPAKEVGGDFYDFFLMGEDHLAMVVGDVSGKGVPAALFMMISKTILKTQTQAETAVDPARVLMEVNTQLSENNKESMFVTVWLGVLEISTGKLTYADAGHEKLLLYQDGKWKFLPKKTSVALAMLDPEELELLEDKDLCHNQTVQLRPGDAIFQYTDGVTEAKDKNAEMFGEERLLAAIDSAPSTDPTELLPHIREKIDEFVGEAPQFDDITMLGLRYLGSKEGEPNA